MTSLDRRSVLNVLAVSGAAALASPAFAQPKEKGQPQPPPRFNFEDVLRRAKDLAAAPYDALPPKLPEALNKLDFDAYRDIRFKAGQIAARRRRPVPPAIVPSRLHLQAPGGGEHDSRRHRDARALCVEPVRLRPHQDGPQPAGQSRLRRLPPALSAQFSPQASDEVVSFLGASYFRFLGRGQSYGLSARASSVDTGGDDEEFPLVPRILDRDVRRHARPGDDLRASRRRLGDRRLSFRPLSRRGKRDGGLGGDLSAPG